MSDLEIRYWIQWAMTIFLFGMLSLWRARALRAETELRDLREGDGE